LVFFFSTGTFSAAESAHILRPILEWLFGALTDARFTLAQFLVRKAAHLVVYVTLSALWFRAQRGPRSGWQSSWALLALLVSILVAIGDEVHQTFVPGRTASPWDVLLDGVGALLAQAVIALRARRKSPLPVARSRD
jgi:VanZ family protein